MKHYRIVRITGINYNKATVEFYARRPEIKLQPYAYQQNILFQNAITYGDGFSRGMKSLGHDAHEIVYDMEILQKTWAKEKGIKYRSGNWHQEIILKQIEYIKPDIVYFQGLGSLHHSIRKNLKRQFPFIKLVVVYTGFPGAFNELDDVDILLAGTPTICKQYKDVGLSPQLVYHAFDDALLNKIGADDPVRHNPKYDFTFAGSSGFGFGLGHHSRYWALTELIKRTPLELWIYEHVEELSKISVSFRMQSQIRQSLKNLLRHFSAETLSKLSPKLSMLPIGSAKVKRIISEIIKEQQVIDDAPDPRLPQKPLREMFPLRCHDPAFGLDMYRILYQSKVLYNRHTDAALDCIGNMRMFDVTGMGTCLLTDTGRNMSDLFEADHEVVTYTTVDECIEKVNYLLEHDAVRRQIAKAGQARTLRDHTVINRCRQIDEIFQKEL